MTVSEFEKRIPKLHDWQSDSFQYWRIRTMRGCERTDHLSKQNLHKNKPKTSTKTNPKPTQKQTQNLHKNKPKTYTVDYINVNQKHPHPPAK